MIQEYRLSKLIVVIHSHFIFCIYPHSYVHQMYLLNIYVTNKIIMRLFCWLAELDKLCSEGEKDGADKKAAGAGNPILRPEPGGSTEYRVLQPTHPDPRSEWVRKDHNHRVSQICDNWGCASRLRDRGAFYPRP